MTDWTKNAIGLYTKNASWTNLGFDFIVGWAGESWYPPNPELKPIELKATTEGKPFLALWNFSADEYTRRQLPMNEALWTPPEDDAQLQMFIRALTSRDVKAVIVLFSNNKDHDGKVVAPNYYSFAAKIFCQRASDWVALYKNVPFIAGSSDAFIKASAPELDNWIGKYFSLVDEKGALSGAYPTAEDKPGFLDNNVTWEFWWYYSNLVLFVRNREGLWDFLSLSNPPPPITVVPEKPVLKDLYVTDSSFYVEWTQPIGGSVIRYEVIKVIPPDGMVHSTTQTSFSDVISILPETIYTYEICAIGEAGKSMPLVVSFTTPVEPSLSPSASPSSELPVDWKWTVRLSGPIYSKDSAVYFEDQEIRATSVKVMITAQDEAYMELRIPLRYVRFVTDDPAA